MPRGFGSLASGSCRDQRGRGPEFGQSIEYTTKETMVDVCMDVADRGVVVLPKRTSIYLGEIFHDGRKVIVGLSTEINTWMIIDTRSGRREGVHVHVLAVDYRAPGSYVLGMPVGVGIPVGQRWHGGRL